MTKLEELKEAMEILADDANLPLVMIAKRAAGYSELLRLLFIAKHKIVVMKVLVGDKWMPHDETDLRQITNRLHEEQHANNN